MGFCNAFDEHLATHGPAAVFLPDHEGLYRFDASWTRDAWQRSSDEHGKSEPHAPGWRYVLVRDHDTGFVQMVLVTSPSLLAMHPRGDVRSFTSEADATAARDAFGTPPVAPEPWC